MNWISTAVDAIVDMIGKISWKQKNPLSVADQEIIKQMLTTDYYIILTRRSNYLSTYAIAFANLVLTGKWGFYSHALMNMEDVVKDPSDFRLIEATGHGVGYSSFDKVFNSGLDAAVLLKPKHMSIEDWTKVMDAANENLGKPYDSLFDLKNDNALSCVELVRNALKGLPDYNERFADFEEMIKKNRNLAPQMFFDCKDFEVVFQINKG